MTFTLKKIPSEVSEFIELPNMAELMCYPIFYDISLDEAYKYASDFQRKLIDMVPLRGTKKYTTVLSEVRILDNRHRSCTGFNQNSFENNDLEWHIDSEESPEDGKMYRYFEETDIVHLLTSEASSMTEFLKNDVELDWNPQYGDVAKFYGHLLENSHKLVPEKMPHNRIVTFTNHLHRASPSSGIEFKYMFRIVETDRMRPPSVSKYNRDLPTTIMNTNNEKVMNIQQQDDKICIYLPETIRDSGFYRPTKPTLIEESNIEENLPELKEENKLKELEIHNAGWETEYLGFTSSLINFTPKNSVMLIHYGEFNSDNIDGLNKFFNDVDREALIIDENNVELFRTHLVKSFYDDGDVISGNIAGTYIEFTNDQLSKLSSGKKYKVKFNDSNEIKFTANDDLSFTCKKR